MTDQAPEKREYIWLSDADAYGLEEWLNEQVKDGWHLKKLNQMSAVFVKRSRPSTYRTMFGKAISDSKKEDYLDKGWEYKGIRNHVLVFQQIRENAEELLDDKEEYLAVLKRMKRVLWIYLCAIPAILLFLVGTYLSDPIDFFLSNPVWSTILLIPLCFISILQAKVSVSYVNNEISRVEGNEQPHQSLKQKRRNTKFFYFGVTVSLLLLSGSTIIQSTSAAYSTNGATDGNLEDIPRLTVTDFRGEESLRVQQIGGVSNFLVPKHLRILETDKYGKELYINYLETRFSFVKDLIYEEMLESNVGFNVLDKFDDVRVMKKATNDTSLIMIHDETRVLYARVSNELLDTESFAEVLKRTYFD
ncbi:DUF2812 domain-containing protein [Mangrovibacillus cuniculi]|uniref:DUF2812 domain-containing protein n=1 Tax=Mangrovibacillus cuniculi TaxID=2593652 RepID=A0A7S8CE21_9BACI|nr:DUF2812 domain-containing protein [Mangrovibacillus cuniculi]QPC48103.1 DUF2812 domain-containing protein [Mangrovibacillus cuniculi]